MDAFIKTPGLVFLLSVLPCLSPRVCVCVCQVALSPAHWDARREPRRVRAVQTSFGVISALVSSVMLNLNYHSSSQREPSVILMWPGRHTR